ncbi:MAG: hypothetical protein ACOYJD_06135 [Christensenellales bacterium]|jgi:hypothetical protein
MAKDALCLWLNVALSEGKQIPDPSMLSALYVNDGEFVTLIEADMEGYRQLRNSQPIRRTVSIPLCLDSKAQDAGLSLSKVLQDALKEILG